MSIKLNGNGMWESMRMMIPQHRERSVQQQREVAKQVRPELTEEEQQELFGQLRASLSNTLEVEITLFDEYENKKIIGIVTGLDPRHQLAKVQTGQSWELIQFCDVIGVEFDVERF
ncbi:YolD-like family protein [Paenibacillus ehimensis]|uniref:YolD-like family protein n=1 Tax=Paenibacillus ehimensis TaxID=79264 RepID=A0ABT8VI40_9BACL|nr:YolD-like family protein [Paenibacillus ehimensis]MDO3680657.1 YolD-like family protein [Paenibacillus ehimensis]